MYIYFLLVFFLIGVIISFKLFSKDFVAPITIYFFTYFISVLCASFNINKWGINISLQAFLILVLGSIEFFVISYIIYKMYGNYQKGKKSKVKRSSITEIKIEKYKLILLLLYGITTIVLLTINVKEIAFQFGEPTSIKEMLSIYRYNVSYHTNARLERFTSLLIKPLFAIAYINLFVFINNFIASNKSKFIKLKENTIYLLPVVIYLIYNILVSSRLSIITIVIAGFIMSVIIWNYKHNWTKKISYKTIFYIFCVGIVGLILFYFTGTLIGRNIKTNFFDYITMYCGGSIQLFDMYLKNPIAKSAIFGYETFFGFVVNLNDYFNVNVGVIPTGHLEWRYSNGYNVGNVYTAFRRWYQDFGYLGIFVLQFIFACFYNLIYYKFHNLNYDKDKTKILIIYYSYFCYSLFTHCIDSTFYSFTFRLSFITQFIVFMMVYFFEFKIKLKK